MSDVQRLSKKFKRPIIIPDYDHQEWLGVIKGYEHEPEKGARCHLCYHLRLTETAKIAKQLGYSHFVSTLSVSPYKLAAVINQQGGRLAGEYGLRWLNRDFKKQDGFKKSLELAKQFNFYRQNYCGCEFSKR